MEFVQQVYLVNNMDYIKNHLRSIIALIILSLGLVVGMVLIKNPTIFKSKAAADIDYPGALNITDSSNQQLKYKGEGVYVIKSDKVKIGVKDFGKLVQKGDTVDTTKAVGTYTDPRDNQNYELKQMAPLSDIPKECSSIGPSAFFRISQEKPYLVLNDKGEFIEVDPLKDRVFPIDSMLVLLGRFSGLSYSWKKADDGRYYPLSQGQEDARWVVRAIRVYAALGGVDFVRIWYGKNYQGTGPGYYGAEAPKDLKEGCTKILEKVEQMLLEGKWVPSYDEIEKMAMQAVG